MASEKKRALPTLLQKLLQADVQLSRLVCDFSSNVVALRSLRTHAKLLEISCHGILWLGGWLALIWIIWKPSWFEMQVNFFIGLLVDILIVALLKAITRRRRPAGNQPQDMFITIGPDKYSFPSGHVSRACYIAYFFIYLSPVHFIFILPLLAWSFSVSFSRILLQRHHLLDVMGGIVLGVAEAWLISVVWISQPTAVALVSWITDEHVEGGEYHV